MPPTLRIAIGFLVSRKRSMLMSLAGVVFGVGFFIITQAQTSGFEQFYIRTIIGTDSPMRIQSRWQSVSTEIEVEEGVAGAVLDASVGVRFVDGIEYPEQLREAVQAFDEVEAVSEVVRGEASGETNFGRETVMVNGIRLRDHMKVTNLEQQLVDGDLRDFEANPNRAMVGWILAERLRLRVGDYVVVDSVGVSRRYQIAAIFESGVELIDRRRIFLHLAEARSVLGKPFGGALFQIGLADPSRARDLAERMEPAIRHRVISWQEREKTWLQVFVALRASSAITVSTIILISGLGMFNTLAMLVLEKTREIAILRSMGYTRADLTAIFLWQGSIVAIAGTLIGWLMGAAATWGISKLPIRIRGVFSTDSFVVNWDFDHYLWAAVITIVVTIVASFLPARKAARLEPGNVIRGTN